MKKKSKPIDPSSDLRELRKTIIVLKQQFSRLMTEHHQLQTRLEIAESFARRFDNRTRAFDNLERAFWNFQQDYNRRFQISPEFVAKSDNLLRDLISLIEQTTQERIENAKAKTLTAPDYSQENQDKALPGSTERTQGNDQRSDNGSP